ncbi:MAG: hypothetical protein GKR94_31735 [Gammaproteobacteria bacterium]|nr:hypothetical protein [Gammaproteobacteria bacterium]
MKTVLESLGWKIAFSLIFSVGAIAAAAGWGVAYWTSSVYYERHEESISRLHDGFLNTQNADRAAFQRGLGDMQRSFERILAERQKSLDRILEERGERLDRIASRFVTATEKLESGLKASQQQHQVAIAGFRAESDRRWQELTGQLGAIRMQSAKEIAALQRENGERWEDLADRLRKSQERNAIDLASMTKGLESAMAKGLAANGSQTEGLAEALVKLNTSVADLRSTVAPIKEAPGFPLPPSTGSPPAPLSPAPR